MRIRIFLAIVLCAFWSSLAVAQQASKNAIETYVHAPDASYEWEIVSQNEVDGVESAVVEMTSQTWLTEEEVDRPVWKHWVNFAIPRNITSDAALLMISGGRNGGDPPDSVSDKLRQLAKATGAVVLELKMVPNQPLVFNNDGARRSEDDLIGYTWNKYLETGEARWLARGAMVKSAVRAMDTAEAVVKQLRETEIRRFVVAGASKRGWTTWLTGAMDDRVVAIAPIVIDVLNVDQSMRHHFAAYGYWAPAIGNYIQHRIMQRMDHPRIAALYKLVDPYAYLDQLDMPKLMLNAAGDQFFLPDSSRFYLKDLPGENHVRYVPNTDHSMKGGDAIESLVAFFFTIAHDLPRPEYAWSITDGKLRVECKTQPASVLHWMATNPNERDFRLETLGPKYVSHPLEEVADGIYEAELVTPEAGWTAQFIELTFEVGAPVPLKLTTPVQILPDTLPYSDRDPGGDVSVTLRCLAVDEAAAGKLAQNAIGLMASKLNIEDARSKVDSETFYINWQPSDFQAEAGAVMGWLESQSECKKINVQLESGRQITSRPAAVSAK